MTEAEAYDYVARWADTNTAPALCEGEILDILDACRLADVDGRPPADPDWGGAWWLPRAVQMAFELRYAKAAVNVDVTADGTTIRASQHAEALRAQAQLWRSRCGGSVVPRNGGSRG